MGHVRPAGFLALPHELPLRCVRTVELTSCVGHERQEGDAHLSMCWAKACRLDAGYPRLGRARLAALAGWGEACRLCMGVDRDVLRTHFDKLFNSSINETWRT
jgi:hypothetical protein